MAFNILTCPSCGIAVKAYRNPVPTVDIIIEINNGIVLIERKNDPIGWALPGGFVDYGEKLEDAAVREAFEETSINVTDLKLLGCYSDPDRDKRQHTISTVYIAKGSGMPMAGDDAAKAVLFPLDNLPQMLCFDHDQIIHDYLTKKIQL
ncbi:MAG: NUDIX hydrolase [Geobacteraceae bacterium]|nr:NUDIX hydrolase [Geobacteraceae bacterium]